MSAHNITPKKILVVDDEPFVCEAVRMMLKFDGHDVVTASSGKEALAIFESGKFDLVITDYAMPVMKGDELASAIRALVPDQPIVLITAYAEMLKAAAGPLNNIDQVIRILKASAAPLESVDQVISKPFIIENLRDAVQKATVR